MHVHTIRAVAIVEVYLLAKPGTVFSPSIAYVWTRNVQGIFIASKYFTDWDYVGLLHTIGRAGVKNHVVPRYLAARTDVGSRMLQFSKDILMMQRKAAYWYLKAMYKSAIHAQYPSFAIDIHYCILGAVP